MVYDITDAELSALTSNSIEEYPIERRLELLNTVIQEDFADKITMDSLNHTERIGITLHPEVELDWRHANSRNKKYSCPWKLITDLHHIQTNRPYCKKMNPLSENHRKEL